MSSYSDKKDGTIFPTRTGVAQGAATERSMLDKTGGASEIRTEIRDRVDGSKVLLRTRNGFPEFSVESEPEVEVEEPERFLFFGETAKYDLFGASTPYKIELNFKDSKAKVTPIPMNEYDGSDGTEKWKLYRRNRKWQGAKKEDFLYHRGPDIDMGRHGLRNSSGSIRTLYTGQPLSTELLSKQLTGALGLFDVTIGDVTYKAIANEVDVYNFANGLPLSNYGYSVQRPTWSPVNYIFWNGVPTIFRLPDGKTTVAINVRPTYDNGKTYLAGGSYTFDDVSGVLTKIAEDAEYSMVGQVVGIKPVTPEHDFDPVYGGAPSGYERNKNVSELNTSASAVSSTRAIVSGHMDAEGNFVPLVFDCVYSAQITDRQASEGETTYTPTEFDTKGNGECGTYAYSGSMGSNTQAESRGTFTASVGGLSVTETFSDSQQHSSTTSKSGEVSSCPVGSAFPGIPPFPDSPVNYSASAGGKTFASHLSVPEERVHLVMFLRAEHPSHFLSSTDQDAGNIFLNTFPDTAYTPVVYLFDCKHDKIKRFELPPTSLNYQLAGRGFASMVATIPLIENTTTSGAVVCDAAGCQKYASGVLPEAISAAVDGPGIFIDTISYAPPDHYPPYSLYGAVCATEKVVLFSVRNPKNPSIVLNIAVNRKTGKQVEFSTPDGKSFQLLYEGIPRMKNL